MWRLFLFMILVVTVAGCIDPPEYPDTPEIEFKSLSRNQIDQRDSLTISFTFQDGDGDIGFKNVDTLAELNPCDTAQTKDARLNLFLLDNRIKCFEPFNTPFLPDKGSADAISGTIRVTIGGQTTCCKAPPNFIPCNPPTNFNTDTVTFTIQIKDRAGNFSNQIETPPIFISCNNQ